MSRWLLPALLLALLIAGCGTTHCSLPPSITGQSPNQTVAAGERAIFTVAASGSTPLSYQWYKGGSPIPGANQASYVTPITTTADSGSSFSVAISNSLGDLTSDPAYLLVNATIPLNARFVSPTGNDSDPGTINQPYRTIQHCATAVSAGATCEVRAGTYRETVTPNSGITITSYNFEPVVVDGSDPITGWSLYKQSKFGGSVYKAKVNLRLDDTNQIFLGQEMMTEARWPNGDNLLVVNWAQAKSKTDAAHIVDRDLPPIDWTGAKIHLWSGRDAFGHQTGNVIASQPGQITVDVQTGTCTSICPEPGGYYYLFGLLSALDSPREWYFDSNSMTLYFMPPGGDPNELDVRSKQRDYAFDLRGKVGVTVRNIGVFASTIVTDDSSSNNTLSGINAKYVSHFTALRNTPQDPDGSGYSILFVHTTDTGIMIYGSGNVVENSTIAYSAGPGVSLQGSNNIIRNNLIHHVDYIGNYSSGIVLAGSDNTIQHNTIHDVGRQGININGVINQDIGYNNIFNAMEMSRDGAAIYACCLQVASGTRIHHNWLHDTQPVIGGTAYDYTLAGVYIDNGSGGFLVDQNVVWHNYRHNLYINGLLLGSTPNPNTLANNTIPDSASHGSIRILWVPNCTATHVTDNRVVVGVESIEDGTACDISNNQATAPGATEMSSSTSVGCNFAGCSSAGPPAIQSGGQVSSCPVDVFAKP